MALLKPFIILMLTAILFAVSAGPCWAQATGEAARSSTIKAGMVLNFIRYTEWPAGAFSSQDEPIVLSILGDSDMDEALVQTISDQQVHGRSVQVRRIEYPKSSPGETGVSDADMDKFARQLRESHVVFVCDSERAHLDTVLTTLDKADVLTVSDIKEFAEQGGMLGLTIRRDRVSFDANPDKIEATQLKVSSKLLRLARAVKSSDK